MESELVPAGEVKFDLALARAPKQVLAEAQEAAKSLQSVISNRKNAVKFNGKHYLSFEDWQTCGRFYGVTARIVSTEPCEMDGVKGFIARAEAVSTQTGQILSAAESMCMNDEPNWSKKPLFQLRSMAQTRACAKSLRNVLAWVVVLAGYEPSVAEEMTGEETEEFKPIPEPKRASAPKAEAKPGTNEVTAIPTDYSTKAIGDGTKHGVKLNGEWYSTFSDSQGETLKNAAEMKAAVKVTFVIKGTYKNIQTVELA